METRASRCSAPRLPMSCCSTCVCREQPESSFSRRSGTGAIPRRQFCSQPSMTDDAVLSGIRLGAKGYLMKDVSLATLTEAIRLVASGGTLISPVVTEGLLRRWKGAPLPASLDDIGVANPLTLREIEILRLMTGGYTNHEIAAALGLSDGTVKNHVSNILSKLRCRDRTRAVLKAIEHGYV